MRNHFYIYIVKDVFCDDEVFGTKPKIGHFNLSKFYCSNYMYIYCLGSLYRTTTGLKLKTLTKKRFCVNFMLKILVNNS